MGCCKRNKIKYQCDEIATSDSITYNTALPEWSSLTTCVSVEDTLNEIYTALDEKVAELDFSNIGSCLEIDKPKQTISSILETLVTEICTLKEESIKLQDTFDISKLNLSCFEEQCEAKINTLPELLQQIVDAVCPGYEGSFFFMIDTDKTEVDYVLTDCESVTKSYSVSSLRGSSNQPWDVDWSSVPDWISVYTTQDSITLVIDDFCENVIGIDNYSFSIDNGKQLVNINAPWTGFNRTYSVDSYKNASLHPWVIQTPIQNSLHPNWVNINNTQSSITISIDEI